MSLFDNFYVLIEDSDDAGRALLAKNVRKTLIENIAQLLVLIDGAQPGLIKSALKLITRLKIAENEQNLAAASMLLIETLMIFFFEWMEKRLISQEVDDLFSTTWNLLVNLATDQGLVDLNTLIKQKT